MRVKVCMRVGMKVWGYDVGECNVACSQKDVLGWLLFMVMQYPLFQPHALLEKS